MGGGLGADRVELFTEPFARAFERGARPRAACAPTSPPPRRRTGSASASTPARPRPREPGAFRELPHLDEVSIGHALISRALFDGLAATVREYLDVLGDDEGIGGASVVAGVLFGFLAGWIIGASRALPASAGRLCGRRPAPGAQQASPGAAAASSMRRAQDRRSTSRSAPPTTRATPRRAELGNLYFDAERYRPAIPWYEGGARDQPRRTSTSRPTSASATTTQPGRSGARAVRALAADRREAHQDDAEHRHRAGLRQAGSRRRRADLAAGRRDRARQRRRARGEADDRGRASAHPDPRAAPAGASGAGGEPRENGRLMIRWVVRIIVLLLLLRRCCASSSGCSGLSEAVGRRRRRPPAGRPRSPARRSRIRCGGVRDPARSAIAARGAPARRATTARGRAATWTLLLFRASRLRTRSRMA